MRLNNSIGDQQYWTIIINLTVYNTVTVMVASQAPLLGYQPQWRIQDLKEGGARSIAREARARAQNFSHAPKTLTTPLIYAFLKIAG